MGRDADLTRLLRLLTQPDGRAGVIIAGSTGMGKTRLAMEALATLSDRHTVIRLMTNWPDGAVLERLSATSADRKRGSGVISLSAMQVIREIEGSGDSSRKLLLFVDDADLLDSATAAFVFELAVQCRIRLLLALNTRGDVPALITKLWRDEHVHRIDLRPLDPPAARRLAVALLGRQLTYPTAARLAQLADGNPLLMRELTRAAAQGHMTSSPAGLSLAEEMPLPAHFSELIMLKIKQLMPTERDALERMVLAEPVTLHALQRIAGEESLLRLEGLEFVHVEATTPQDPSLALVRSFHPLVGHVIRRSIPALRRRAHLQMWIAIHGEEGEAKASVTGWRLDVGEIVAEETLLRAAQNAIEGHDFQAATRFTAAAWHHYATARAAAAHVLSLISVADFDAANQVLTTVESRHVELPQELIAARVRWYVLQGRLKEAESIICHLTGRLQRLHLGMTAYWQGSYMRAMTLCGPLTDDLSDPYCIEASIFQMAALVHAGRPADALDLHARVSGQVSKAGAFHADSLEEIYANALADSGRLEEAADVLTRAYDRAIAEQHVRIDAQRALALGVVMLGRGRPQQALNLFVSHAAHPVGWQLWQIRARFWETMATATLGRPHEMVLPPAQPSPSMAFHAIARAWAMFLTGDRHQSAALLLETAEACRSLGGHADVAAILHELGRLGLIQRAATDWDIPLQGPYLQARRDYARAIVTNDVALMRRVGEAFVEAGAELFAAEAYAELARLYRTTAQPRAATAATLRARALAARCEGAATPPLLLLESTEPLTLREREIVLLVAQGLSDKAVAERLTVSVRTVGNHLYRIYRKMGVVNRGELQRMAAVPPSGAHPRNPYMH
ncbi:LuxR C-terminal-related transcriptional regulator [Streptomyces sp. NBC_00289]|uniref:LuxR C-terminal-related transcriptional regulator n=1 Tax=Streptomyces sp. NBC_00289 TaxID=2975703 RepID=UPI00324EBD6F